MLYPKYKINILESTLRTWPLTKWARTDKPMHKNPSHLCRLPTLEGTQHNPQRLSVDEEHETERGACVTAVEKPPHTVLRSALQ